MPQDKLPIKDFAAKIKAKYPEYNDIEDSVLARKVVDKYPEYNDMVDFGPSKASSLGAMFGGAAPTPVVKNKSKELGAAFGKVATKAPPQNLAHGIQKDKEANSILGGIYNTIVGGVAELAGGIGQISEWKDPLLSATVKTLGTTTRKQANELVDKARSSSSSRENEQNRGSFNFADGVDWSDIKGIAFSAPSQVFNMGLGAATGGLSFVGQGVNTAAKELEENPNANLLTPNQKVGYVVLQATVQAALEKFSVDKIFKSTGISKKVQQKIAAELVEEFSERGIKATAKQIEEAAIKKASSLATKIKNVGVKATTGFVAEGSTEGVQQMGSDGIKLLANKLKKKEIFDEQDIKQNFAKNVINSFAGGGVFGTVAGAGSGALQNTNKAIRNELAKGANYEQIQQQIAQQVEAGNMTPQEAAYADLTTQQYAQIASKIPGEVAGEKMYEFIGGISQREELTKEIEAAKIEMEAVDPAFRGVQQDRVDLLQAKLDQTNDYIEGLVLDKQPEYKKEGETYKKVDGNGKATEITKQHYELATAIKKEDKATAKEEATYSEKEKLEIAANKLYEDANALPPTEADAKAQMWAEGDRLREQAEAIPEPEVAASSEVASNPKLEIIQKALANNEPSKGGAMMTKMANDEATTNEFLKGVADQALNKINPENSTPEAAREQAEKMFGKSIVDLAVESYPAEVGATSESKGEMELEDLFVPGKKIVIDGKKYNVVDYANGKGVEFLDENGLPPTGIPRVTFRQLENSENRRELDYIRYQNGYKDAADIAKSSTPPTPTENNISTEEVATDVATNEATPAVEEEAKVESEILSETQKLEAERDAKIAEIAKPDLKLKLVSAKELANAVDPLNTKKKHDDIKKRSKQLLQLIDCLTKVTP